MEFFCWWAKYSKVKYGNLAKNECLLALLLANKLAELRVANSYQNPKRRGFGVYSIQGRIREFAPSDELPTGKDGAMFRTHILKICDFPGGFLFGAHHKHKKDTHQECPFCVGDPYGNRTHVTAVKGPCLNRLTNGPLCGSGCRIWTNDLPGMNRTL